MAVGTVAAAFPVGTNMDLFDVGLLASGTFSAESATSYTVTIGSESLVFTGTGFTYGGSGNPTGGVVTALQDSYQGAVNLTVTGLSINVTSFNTWAAAADNTSAKNAMFGGADTLTAGSHGDVLRAYAGNDSIVGGAGNDTLDGGLGNDTIVGGAGHDMIITGGGTDLIKFGLGDSAVNQSTADVITDWNSADTLTFASGPSGTVDYSETTAASFAAATTAANALIATGNTNVAVVAVGADLVVFVDSANNNGTADDAVILQGRTLADISISNFTLTPGAAPPRGLASRHASSLSAF